MPWGLSWLPRRRRSTSYSGLVYASFKSLCALLSRLLGLRSLLRSVLSLVVLVSLELPIDHIDHLLRCCRRVGNKYLAVLRAILDHRKVPIRDCTKAQSLLTVLVQGNNACVQRCLPRSRIARCRGCRIFLGRCLFLSTFLFSRRSLLRHSRILLLFLKRMELDKGIVVE